MGTNVGGRRDVNFSRKWVGGRGGEIVTASTSIDKNIKFQYAREV